MKKTIVAIDTNDIFQTLTRTTNSAFSAISITAERTDEFYIANLCLELFDRLQVLPFQVCESGDALMRITSPVAQAITIEEVEMICESIRRFCSANIIWGAETDDSIETVNVNLIFEINMQA